MARPKKHSDGLTKPISFRLVDDNELKEFHKKVSAYGGSRSDFIRDCVLKNKTVVVAKPKASLEKKRMQFIFNKTGNNLNQIARVLNEARMAGKISDQMYQTALLNLSNISQYLKSALCHVD